jgi:hypothetical protein
MGACLSDVVGVNELSPSLTRFLTVNHADKGSRVKIRILKKKGYIDSDRCEVNTNEFETIGPSVKQNNE